MVHDSEMQEVHKGVLYDVYTRGTREEMMVELQLPKETQNNPFSSSSSSDSNIILNNGTILILRPNIEGIVIIQSSTLEEVEDASKPLKVVLICPSGIEHPRVFIPLECKIKVDLEVYMLELDVNLASS